MSKFNSFGGVAGSTGGYGQRLAKPLGAFPNNSRNMVLHVAAEADPAVQRTAQCGQVVEIRMLCVERLELFLIVDIGFVAGAVDEPYLFAPATVGATLREEPLRIAAHGRNACSRCNQDRIGDGLMKHKVPMRPVNLDRSARRQIGEVGKMIRKEPVLDTVHAKIEVVAAWRRRNRVGARLLFAILVGCDGRNKLARRKGKVLHAVDGKVEVVALGDFRDADFLLKTRGNCLTCQRDLSLFREEWKA